MTALIYPNIRLLSFNYILFIYEELHIPDIRKKCIEFFLRLLKILNTEVIFLLHIKPFLNVLIR